MLRAAVMGLGLLAALPASAQWTPRPTPLPTRPPAPPPTPRPPAATPTPRPAATATPTPTPAATPAPSATPSPCQPRVPLIRLRPAPLLVAKPPIGSPLPCGITMQPFGCRLGDPVELDFYHSDDPGEAAAVYQLVRVR